MVCFYKYTCLLIAFICTVDLQCCSTDATPFSSTPKTSPVLTGQHHQCPPWFYWNESSFECDCASEPAGVRCNEAKNRTWLSWFRCMTFDETTETTVVAMCLYTDVKAKHSVLLPKDLSQLNHAVCGNANREGMLCSKCKSGYGPSLLSYDHRCAKCSQDNYGWLLFICLALLPPTALFFVIVMCQIKTTSASLNFYVFACQLISVSIMMCPSEIHYHSNTTKIIYSIGVTFVTLWNFDFFRYLIPSFCVSESLSNLQVLCMDYIVAFYPLLLTVLMYVLIQQHGRGSRILVYLWRPIGYCLTPLIKSNWNPAASIVPTFASFLLLSSTKILSVSLSLLQTGEPVTNLSVNGMISVHTNLLYYEPKLSFFSQSHLPYAILAIFTSTTFVILPCLVLILYPTRLFQKFLNWCGIGCHAVHAFADAFNGCYKNGTNGTRDYRCFAGFYLLARVLIITKITVLWVTDTSALRVISVASVLLFALASPYKTKLFNILDSFGMALLACLFCIPNYRGVFNTISVAYLMLYFVGLVSCKLTITLNCCCYRKLKELVKQVTSIRDAQDTERPGNDVESSIPDRVLNPDGYRLLTERNEQPLYETLTSDCSVPTYGAI